MTKLFAFAALACVLTVQPALAQPISSWAQPQLKEMDQVFGQPVDGLTFEGSAPGARWVRSR